MKNRTENKQRKQHRNNILLLQEIPREYTNKIFIFIYFGTRSQCITKCEFYIHDSVHRDSILIRSNKMQQYAGIYFLQVYSTCFGRPSRPSSGVQKECNCSLWYR